MRGLLLLCAVATARALLDLGESVVVKWLCPAGPERAHLWVLGAASMSRERRSSSREGVAYTNSRVADPWICRQIEFAHPRDQPCSAHYRDWHHGEPGSHRAAVQHLGRLCLAEAAPHQEPRRFAWPKELSLQRPWAEP
jgi:hypothetical protein